MVCLIKKFYKKQIEDYASILGSESAAYYVLAMNNGYTLDKDPWGGDSTLYQDIFNACGGNKQRAIIEKALYYTQDYIKTNGDWTEGDNEPAYNPSLTVTQNTVSQDILQNDRFGEIKASLSASGIVDDNYAMKTAIENTRQDYIDWYMADYEGRNRKKQLNKYNSESFFKKVLMYFPRKISHKKIKRLTSEQKQQARKEAYEQFNKTLENLILSETLDLINGDEVHSILKNAIENNNRPIIHAIFSFMDIASKPGILTLDNKNTLSSALKLLKLFDNDHYNTIVKEFGTANKLINALLDNDISHYTVQQQFYLSNFMSDFDNIVMEKLRGEISSPIEELLLMYFQQAPITDVNKKAYDVIVEGFESRLVSTQKTYKSADKKVVYTIKSRLERAKSKDIYSTKDMHDMYFEFLESADSELRSAQEYLEKTLLNPDKISAADIMYLQTDVIGYYNHIIQNYIITLDDKSGLSSSQLTNIKQKYDNDVKKKLSDVIQSYDKVLDIFTDKIIDKYVDENYTLGDIDGHKRALKAWVRNEINNGHLGLGETLLGDATQSKSPIVRMIANMLNNDDRKVDRESDRVGHKLLGLFCKAEGFLSKLGICPTNRMKAFCETDRNGYPTGYFARGYVDEHGNYVGINYGQFEQDKREFEEKLRLKYGLSSDQHGNTEWNFDIKGERDTYNKYMDELDDWLEQHCERQYTKEYYKQRRLLLSTDAQEELDAVSFQIQLLLDKCTDSEGFVFTNKLTPSERARLDILRKQRDELGNPYSVIYDISGNVISFKMKTGRDLEIAESIIAWNNFLNKGLMRQPDEEKYNKALSKITDPAERAKFIADNTTKRISSEFYEQLAQCTTATQTQEYLRLSAYKNKILGLTKQTKGWEYPSLLKLNDEAWQELKRLEEEMANVKTTGRKGAVSFDDIATVIPVVMPDPSDPTKNISVIKYLENQARAQLAVNPNALKEFYKKYFIEKKDSSGNTKLVALSVFSMIAPKDASYVSYEPSGAYTKVTGGYLYNPKYKKDINERYQPKASMYRNKKFEKIMKDKNAKAFYDELINTMQESINMLPEGTNASKYKMPQITADSKDLASRGMRTAVQSITKHFTVNETDDDLYREDLKTRPDGTLVRTVPMRYVQTLENPKEISCDIVSTVQQFYAMALNYKLKSATVPYAEALISKMSGGISHSSESTKGQVARAKTEVEMYGYGQMEKGFGDESKKMTKGEKVATKSVNLFRSIANKALLAGNLFSATKGFISAYYKTGAEAFVGRYYDCGDRFYTSYRLLKEFPNALRSIGHGNTHSLIMALMQRNGKGEESYDDHGSLWIRRILKHFSMGAFTVGDYTINAIAMTSTYHATRLVEDINSGELRFMNEEECIDMFVKSGKSEWEAVDYFEKHSSNHLLNMYELGEDGEARIKDDVKVKIGGKKIHIDPHDYVTDKIENRMSATTERIGSMMNGVVARHGKNRIYQGTLSKLLVTMRGYLFSQGWERFRSGNDFDKKYYDKGGIRSMGESPLYRGQYDMETGHCEPGTIASLGQVSNILSYMHDLFFALPLIGRGLRKHYNVERKIAKADMQNIQRFCLDIVGTITFAAIALVCFIPLVRKLPDSWLAHFGLLVSMGCMIETSTMVLPTTVLDLATTVTTTYSFVKDQYRFFQLFGDITGFEKGNSDSYVKSGAYKNKPKWFRDIMKISKVTGAGGYYETFTPAIEGLDNPKKSDDVKQNVERRKRLEKGGIPYASTMDGMYDMYKYATTPLGMQSKYDWYNGNAFPANLLPSRKDKSEKKKSSSSSGGKRPGATRGSRGSRPGATR